MHGGKKAAEMGTGCQQLKGFVTWDQKKFGNKRRLGGLSNNNKGANNPPIKGPSAKKKRKVLGLKIENFFVWGGGPSKGGGNKTGRSP